MVPVQLNDNGTAWQIDAYLNPCDLKESGIYPFVFGARDDGDFYDFGGVVQLILHWQKKPRPLYSTLKSVNEHVDPPNPLRSLRDGRHS